METKQAESADASDEEFFFFEVRCRVVRREGKFLVDTKYLQTQLTPHLSKIKPSK